MAVSLTIDPKKLLGSQLVTGLLADAIGVKATSNKARVAAVASFIKGKSNKQLIETIGDATKPTHVEFINPDDARTSDVCQAVLSGKHVWKIGDPNIKVPPLHFTCRSYLSFISAEEAKEAQARTRTEKPRRVEDKKKTPVERAAKAEKQAEKSDKKAKSAESKAKTAQKKANKAADKTDELRKQLNQQRKENAKRRAELDAKNKEIQKQKKELEELGKQREELKRIKEEAQKLDRSVKRSKTLDSIDPNIQKAKDEILDTTGGIIKRANDLL